MCGTLEQGADSASVSDLFRTSSCVDGVVAMPRRRDAVVRIVRESTRLVSERRRFRDGVRATQAANKFMCPCHGSQYDETGKVVRGPAPLSLALAHITDNAGVVTFTPWTETDFRTGLNPWWK